MRWLTLCISLLALSCFGQAYTYRDTAFMGVARPVAGGAFSPANVSGLGGWWKADVGVYSDLGSTPASNGQQVEQWNDQSGIGSNLTCVAVANRPVYRTSILNGLPALSFMVEGIRFMTNSWGGTKTQPITVFSLCRVTNDANIGFMFDGVVVGNRVGFYKTAADVGTLYAGSAAALAGTPTNQWIYWTFYYNGASSYVRTNGVQVGNTLNPGTGSSTGITVGSQYGLAFPLNCAMVEFLWYNATLADADRNSIEAYLKTRGGL